MTPCIILKIPEVCYISANPQKEMPCTFYFLVTYGFLPGDQVKLLSKEGGGVRAVTGSTITIQNFDKLLSVDKLDEFLKNLKKTGDKDWIIEKSKENEIVITYAGDAPKQEFAFSASTEQFISDAKQNDWVTLTVKVRDFDISDHSYIVKTKVSYAPWAEAISFSKNPVAIGEQTEVSFQYQGDGVKIQLLQGGSACKEAISPYTATITKPERFTLEVFNQLGIKDRVQAEIMVIPPEIKAFQADKTFFFQDKDEPVTLSWEVYSASTICMDYMDEGTKEIGTSPLEVHPKTKPGEKTVTYTLMANGYDENGIVIEKSKKILLQRTYWKKGDLAKGYFAQEVYGNLPYNSRIFTHDGQMYCYAHPDLYKSGDGITWESFSKNDKASAAFVCVAADYNKGKVYVMGKEEGTVLCLSTYDFSGNQWIYEPAYQYCNSNMGAFCFSKNSETYVQVMEKGLTLHRRGDDGAWNAGNAVICTYGETKVVAGDHCFFKDREYAVMLCHDQRIYVYDCSKDMEEVLFRYDSGENSRFVCFIKTINNLYVMSANLLLDVKSQKPVDAFSPARDVTGRPWMGVNSDGRAFGLFPDKAIWTYESDGSE